MPNLAWTCFFVVVFLTSFTWTYLLLLLLYYVVFVFVLLPSALLQYREEGGGDRERVRGHREGREGEEEERGGGVCDVETNELRTKCGSGLACFAGG